MRPVEKKNVGETVSYVNSCNQTVTETIQENSPYNKAKMPLLGNRDFIYTAGGAVLLNPNLDEDEKNKAKKLFDLVKLGAYPGNGIEPTSRDFRWKKRLETWDLAERLRNKFNAGTADVDEIISMAQKLGYWSVWFTVFKGYDEVRRRLICDFSGTCTSCFEANNHYEPIKRNG